MSSDDWNFKIDPQTKTKVKPVDEQESAISKHRPVKLQLDLESAVKSRSMRVHAGLSYDVKLAPMNVRLQSLAIDAAFIILLTLLLKIFFYENTMATYLSYLPPLLECLIVSYVFIYFVILQVTGHTLGKKLKRVKLEDVDGGPLGFSRLFLRELILKPLCLLLVLPFVIYLISKKHFALHDYLCKSLVSIWDLSANSSQS